MAQGGNISIPVFVLHVKKGYEERARHIDRMMERLGIEFEYFLDGDMEDITPERLERYFSGPAATVRPATSVALKHLLIFEKMIAVDIPYALIFEDDIFLKDNFTKIFDKSLEQVRELTSGPERPFIVSYEATCLKLVPRSQRRKGKVIYPADMLQCMGAYLVNNAFAKAIVGKTVEMKCAEPSDIWIDRLGHEYGLYDLYWTHPITAEQGSHNGRMATSLGNPLSDQGSSLRSIRIKRKLSMWYKKLLYFFR